MDIAKTLERLEGKMDSILTALAKDDNELLGSEDIAKELGISINTLYNPKYKFELRQFGMSTSGPLKMLRKDIEKYKKFKVK